MQLWEVVPFQDGNGPLRNKARGGGRLFRPLNLPFDLYCDRLSEFEGEGRFGR